MQDACRIEPGTEARLEQRPTDDRLGIEKGAAQEKLSDLTKQLSVLHQRLYAESARSVLLVLQGLDAAGKDGTIRRVFTGLNPQGCDVVVVQGAVAGRAEARLSLADPHADARTGRHPHLQPVALRRRRGGRGRRRHRRQGTQAALRAHQRVREDARRRRHVDREDLPARRQGRAAAPAPGPARRSREALEVRPGRSRHPGRLGPVHDAVRRRDHGDLDQMGAVVRGARRPQVGVGCDRGGDPARHARERWTRRSRRPKTDLDGIVSDQ